jgi:hypothetical protein
MTLLRGVANAVRVDAARYLFFVNSLADMPRVTVVTTTVLVTLGLLGALFILVQRSVQ